MARLRLVTVGLGAIAGLLVMSSADAAVVKKCGGQTWSELAKAAYGKPTFGPLLAAFNKKPGTSACETGQWVRYFSPIEHVMREGQTLESIASRFLRGKGGVDTLRRQLGLEWPLQPEPNSVVLIPAEVEWIVGSGGLAAVVLMGVTEVEVLLHNHAPDPATIAAGTRIFVPVPSKPDAQAPVAPNLATDVAKPAPVEQPPSASSQPVVEDAPPAAKPPPPAVRQKQPGQVVRRVDSPGALDIGKTDVEAELFTFQHQSHKFGCQRCHNSDEPVQTESCAECHTKTAEFVRGKRVDRLPLMFSHKLHVQSDQRVSREGYTVECYVCHAQSADGARGRAKHAECVRCHNAPETWPVVDINCDGCHGMGETQDRLRAAKHLLDEHLGKSTRGHDVRFEHEQHLEYMIAKAPDPQMCDRCHVGVRETTSLDQLEPIRMTDCMDCHRGLERVMADRAESLDRCRICHIGDGRASRPVFSSVVAKPLSHSPFFAKNHTNEARKDEGACRECHTVLAGGNGDSCDRCHQRMTPRDHTPRFREEPHGRAAVRDPERCATCHLEDRCADCHRLPPRDHFPRNAAIRNHSRWAQRSVRRCQTCHQHDSDCARCHGAQAAQ